MMGEQTIEATIFGLDGGAMRRTLHLDRDSGFGLLERYDARWTLMIPHGASATVEGEPVDLSSLTLEPSGERRMPLLGRRAQIVMAADDDQRWRFEVRPAA